MTTTFFCIETGNSLYGGTVRHFFNSPAAVMSFLKATREGWSLRAAEWDDGELVPTRPITNCPVHRRGRRNRCRSRTAGGSCMKIIPWKRSWLAALLVALGFLLMSHFNAQDRELFNNMAPLTVEEGR